MNIKILVAHHKPGDIISDDVYLPIHVGCENSSHMLDIQGDNVGENISGLNPLFCEMTAVYWGWKNLEADYVGLCHYRRYFTFYRSKTILSNLFYWNSRLFGNWFQPGKDAFTAMKYQIETTKKQDIFYHALKFKDKLIKELDADNDIEAIVPYPYKFPCINIRQFFTVLGRDHISLLLDIVKNDNPEFYTYLEKSLRGNELFAANMFIFKREVFNDYCNTVFPILLKHYQEVKNRAWCMDPLAEKCYSRITGYMAEILTSAYITKMIENDRKIKYVNTIFLAC